VASQSISERINASVVMLIFGVIADVTATVLFFVSSETRSWLQDKYMWVVILTLVLIAVVLSLLNLLQSQQSKIVELSAAKRALELQLASPTRHDVDMFEAFNAYASPQSELLVWLRDGFLVNTVRESEIMSLDRMVRFFGREPRGFDDEELDAKYRSLMQNARVLLNRINANVFPVGATDRYSVPPEWELEQPDLFREVIQGVAEAHDALIQSYDEFVLSAQRKRLNSFIGARVGENS
jgi:hypothetical protein